MSTWKKIKKIKRWVQRWRCQSLSKLHVNPGFCFPKYLRRRKGRRSQRLLRTKRKSRFCSRIKRQSRFCFTCGARTEDLAQKNLKKKTFPSRTTLREPRRVSFDFSAFCTGTDIYIYVQVFLKPIPLIERDKNLYAFCTGTDIYMYIYFQFFLFVPFNQIPRLPRRSHGASVSIFFIFFLESSAWGIEFGVRTNISCRNAWLATH